MAVLNSIPFARLYTIPAAFFLSVLSPDAKAPNGLIYLAYVGAVVLAVGVFVLGIGLVRLPAQRS
jgi:high-affinity Fe2+/Pb2+ permease